MSGFSEILPRIKGEDIYLHLSRENPDWQNHKQDVSLVVHFGGKRVTLPLGDSSELNYLVSSLYHFLDSDRLVLAWGAKDIFSYLRGRTEMSLEVHNQVYDLSLISSYLGSSSARPENFKDAVMLLKRLMSDPLWKKFSPYYTAIHVPMFSSVLPEMETGCIVDNSKKKCVYPTYVMEGQANGRLSTLKINSSSYNPHSIGKEEKSNLRPRGYDELFVCYDYRNMEVAVLQWLSGDPALASILESGRDLYKEIWRKITRQEATDAHRKICKNTFLPVVFGQGKLSLAKNLGSSEEIAAKLIDSLVDTFPVAFDWVGAQSPDSNNTATDVFGRRRTFGGQELYKIKNFCIQSPASMICLRKLVKLHEALAGKASVGFHVHDGYCVLCDKKNLASICELGTKVLEEEDEMFPGLVLKTTCKFGQNLIDLETFTKRVKI